MTFAIHHGVTYHTGTAVQSVERKFTQERSDVLGMVDGRTEIIKSFGHTSKGEGTVTGKGDITVSPGFAESNVAGFTGGKTHIGEVGDKETLGTEAEWTFSFTHLPHAS
ncbi:MAG: hypothetical protein ABMA13_22195 [Chthoniobacteraceae bacterium]